MFSLASCIALVSVSYLVFAVDPTEPEFEETPEQAQEDANFEQDQDKSWCIPPNFLGFSL
jgi:hypothetical protein